MNIESLKQFLKPDRRKILFASIIISFVISIQSVNASPVPCVVDGREVFGNQCSLCPIIYKLKTNINFVFEISLVIALLLLVNLGLLKIIYNILVDLILVLDHHGFDGLFLQNCR